jgi:NAD(P)-dependent dehydrogenase (short-subunit alcohol dehydrogenase family)
MADIVIDSCFSLAGKVALISGGASGIGQAIAEMFASKGAKVAIVDLLKEQAEERAQAIGEMATSWAVDVTSSDSVNSVVREVKHYFGRIDILVHSAGVVALDPAEKVTDTDWSRQIDVNLTGTFHVNRAVGNVMLEQGAGKIINMASQAGSIALREHAAYCASKWGVIGLSKVLAAEWAGRGVTVNTISPTVVMTELGRKAWAGQKGEDLKKQIPTGRFALPEEIAAAAVFLASNGSDMINGADLIIDGGFTIQ